MISITEFFLLGLSLGTLKDWSKNTNADPSYVEKNSVFQPEMESKTLYDLMAHFPTDKDIVCPESDSRFRYPGECTRYITCRDFEAHIRHCPPGMSFDENYSHCRLSFDVDCKSSSMESSCADDEVYSDCGCDRTCRDDKDDDTICLNVCGRGCFCPEGFVRDIVGYCVEPDACENSIHSIFMSNVEDF